MGKVKKLIESELVGGSQSTEIYPVTSTKAVYDNKNIRLDTLLKAGISNNISTRYSTDGTVKTYTLSQAISKVPVDERVSGYVGTYLSSDGWKVIQYLKEDISDWTNQDNWNILANNKDMSSAILLANGLSIVEGSSVTEKEIELCKRIRSIEIKGGSYIEIGFNSVTKNYGDYGSRIVFKWKYNGNWTAISEIKSDTLFNGYTEKKFQFADGQERTICMEIYAEDLPDGVLISNVDPKILIDRKNFTNYSSPEEVEDKIKNFAQYPEWFDGKNNPNVGLLNNEEKTLLMYIQQVAIDGYTGDADLDIYSFSYKHDTYGNRFGIAWTKDGQRTTGKQLSSVDFDSPIPYTIDGQDCKITIIKNNSLPENKIYVSRSTTSVVKLSKLYLPYIPLNNGEEVKTQLSKNTSDIEVLQSNVLDNSSINFLKNPYDKYTSNEELIISSIKNIGFENVPESIKDDDIFIRSFSAASETTGGKYGQQIYFANRRIYEEEQNWGTGASILVSSKKPCNFDVQSFDVTVQSGEMKGMRIRLEVDFSVFTDYAPFNYGTSTANKISFNLNKTWSQGTIQERLNKNEKAIEELKSGDSSVEYKPNKNLVFMGSSNVWGDGFLFYSYLKSPIDFLFKNKASFNPPSKVTVSGESEKISNSKKFLDEEAIKIKGVGSSISFTHKGTELHICQVIERTSEYSVIGLYDGNTKVAEFTNHNNTIGSDSKSFTGDGESTKFELDRCFTYNHSLTVDGTPKTIKLNTQGYGASFPEGTDALVIRSLNSAGKVIHSIWFKDAPSSGASIQVSYKYGETICFVKSTVGEDENNTNESPYGDGTVSYDPINPATIGSGLDYRLVNNKSFYHYHFDNDNERTITLKIERGSSNPYFGFNFASSEYHNVMNAGIGGWTAEMFNSEDYPNRTWYDIANYFTPEIVTIGLTGNDDWRNYPRKVKHTITGVTLEELQKMPSLELGGITYNSDSDTYTVVKNAGVISSITLRSLRSEDIKNTDVSVGDFIRIGTYTGDLRQVQTRRVSEVDISQGEVKWDEPLHLEEFICIDSIEDLVGQDVSIRSISNYMDQMKALITNIKKINPKCKVYLFNVYYVDMWNRNVAEYTYIQKWIASNFDDSVKYIDAWKYSRDYVETSSHSRVINTTANGSSSLTFNSPSSLGHWEGIEVWIGDKNVYGTDCYVETGWLYTVNPESSGSDLNWQGSDNYLKPYDKRTTMTLRWKKNIPSVDTPVAIKLAYNQWSGDYAHPNDGNYIQACLGKALIETVK